LVGILADVVKGRFLSESKRSGGRHQ